MEISKSRDGHWFHEDKDGRFYFKDDFAYKQNSKTYLVACPICQDFIYPKDQKENAVFSKVGNTFVHGSCKLFPNLSFWDSEN